MAATVTDLHEQTATAVRRKRCRSSLRAGAIIALLVAGVYHATAWSAPSFDDWEVDYQRALAKAQETDRNMMIAFYMHGCPPCAVMDRAVLSRRAVRRALDEFVPARLDAVSSPAAERFHVYGTPTYLVVSPKGDVLARTEGYHSVDEFMAFLEVATPDS
jgi:thioredoxin-related protein